MQHTLTTSNCKLTQILFVKVLSVLRVRVCACVCVLRATRPTLAFRGWQLNLQRDCHSFWCYIEISFGFTACVRVRVCVHVCVFGEEVVGLSPHFLNFKHIFTCTSSLNDWLHPTF